jgi:hypothetical protein
MGCLSPKVDQGKTAFCVSAFVQVGGRVAENDLKRRPNLGPQQMSSERGSVAAFENSMDVKSRFAIRTSCHIAGQRRDLDPLLKPILPVFLLFLRLPIEIAEFDGGEGTDRVQLSPVNLVLGDESRDAGRGFIAGGEDHGKSALPFPIVEQF